MQVRRILVSHVAFITSGTLETKIDVSSWVVWIRGGDGTKIGMGVRIGTGMGEVEVCLFLRAVS